MKTLKLLVLGAALMSGLVACPRENIIFSTDPRIVRGNWAGTAKRVCANVSQTAWSPDGTKIVSNGNRTVIWDAVTGARVRVIAEASTQVVWTATSIVTVSPSTYLVGAKGSAVTVKFWNPTSGVLERSLNVIGSTVLVSPDATRAVVSSVIYEPASVSIISLIDGTKQRDLDVTSFGSGTELQIKSVSWAVDGAKVIAQGEVRKVNDYSVPPTRVVRVWQASTGTIERNISPAATVSISPDGKTLVYGDGAYAQTNFGFQFLNLETGAVRALPVSNQTFMGWNPSSAKFYLQAATGANTEVWNSGTLKLEKTVSGSFRPWNTVGAPVDRGVISSTFLQYEPTAECNLKILDLNEFKTILTLDETALGSLEVKLFLNATYLNENQYGIGGTATVGTDSFKVRGLGNAGSNGRLVPQTSPPIEVPTFLELLDANGATVWNVAHFGTAFVSIQPGSVPVNTFEYGYRYGNNDGPDRYNLNLAKTP
jgi:WD40 repeat protein